MNTPKKSLLVTYFLWLFGGLIGLHHFYLARYRHAFVMWISFGGYFGVGWFREMWRIPEYVAEANCDPKYMERLVARMTAYPKPSFGIIRYFAAVIVADILGYLVMGALPHEFLNNENFASDSLESRALAALLVPFACAFGVHLVGNVGRYSGSIKWPLLGAYLTSPLYVLNYNVVFLTSVLALVAFVRYSLQWRRSPLHNRSNSLRSFSILTFSIILYLSLWTSWFYFNCTVTDKNDETIKCRDALRNFFNSPAWLEFRDVLAQLFKFIQLKGFSGLWNEIIEALDPQGEKNALKVLGLTDEASQEKVTAQYRKLARQWHPDKHHDVQEKAVAQERFMVIQEAYNLLSRMKQRRIRKQRD